MFGNLKNIIFIITLTTNVLIVKNDLYTFNDEDSYEFKANGILITNGENTYDATRYNYDEKNNVLTFINVNVGEKNPVDISYKIKTFTDNSIVLQETSIEKYGDKEYRDEVFFELKKTL